MDAAIDYRTLQVGESYRLGEACIDNVVMNHPVTKLGYRIACRGKSRFEGRLNGLSVTLAREGLEVTL